MGAACTRDDYDRLYARWLGRPGDLLDLAGFVPGMRLLDLCGGTGAVSKAALARGAPPEDILLYDLYPRFDGVPTMVGDMVTDDLWGAWDFDVAVCRQAIGYVPPWALRRFMVLCFRFLRVGGTLVFNAPKHPPVFKARTYVFDGYRFAEVSARLWKRVFHLQWAVGVGVDFSTFWWHSREVIAAAMGNLFSHAVVETDTSMRWICRRG